MPTAVEMTWLVHNTTKFSENNTSDMTTAIRDARIPSQSVSVATINVGGATIQDIWERPASASPAMDSWSASASRLGLGHQAAAGLGDLASILTTIKPYMSTNGSISVRGLRANGPQTAYYSSLAGVPVSFPANSEPVQDDWATSSKPIDDWST